MDNENNDLNRINETLKDAEDLVLPEALSEDSIKELLKEQRTLKLVSKKAIYRRIIAFAAVLAIVFTVLIHSKPWQDDSIVVNGGDNKNYSGKVEVPNSPKSYEQIEKMFVKYHKSSQHRFNFPSSFYKGQAVAEDSGSVNENAVGNSVSGKSSYGRTNEQVAGVNEADIIKNDGSYIYMAISRYDYIAYDSGSEGKGEYSEGSAGTAQGAAEEIIVDDGMSKSAVMPGYGGSRSAIAIIKPSANGEMKVESTISAQKDKGISSQSIINMYVKGDLIHAVYDCYDKEYYQASTLVVTFDVSDRQNPFEVRRFYQSGSHISTRLIDDTLILITNYNVAIYEESDSVKQNCIPETGTDFDTTARIPAENICIMENSASPSYLVVSNMNLNLPDKDPVTASILGAGQNIYCTTNKLYVTNAVWDENFAAVTRGMFTTDIAPAGGSSNTTIYSFDISGGNVIFKADKTIEGSVLNQFSIDEYNGYLRIATTTGSFTNANNFVNILSADSLEPVGILKNIAPGESIKSVRFAKERGYVVTFLQTDPLFVIDLSKADSPKILGELKINGFSAYLHPITSTLLAGIGVDGTSQGQTDDLKVSLFDVSDPSDPREVDKAVFGNNTQYAYSAAYYDHKAICYDEDSKTLYFPLEITDYLTYNNNGYASNTFHGVIGLKIDVENKKLGVASKYLLNRGSQPNITRATYIGGLVFACSNSAVYSFDKASEKLLFNLDFSNYEFPETSTPRPNKPAAATQEDSSQTDTTAEPVESSLASDESSSPTFTAEDSTQETVTGTLLVTNSSENPLPEVIQTTAA